jgi:hypothetical protein
MRGRKIPLSETGIRMVKRFWCWLKEKISKLASSNDDIESWRQLEFRDHKKRDDSGKSA